MKVLRFAPIAAGILLLSTAASAQSVWDSGVSAPANAPAELAAPVQGPQTGASALPQEEAGEDGEAPFSNNRMEGLQAAAAEQGWFYGSEIYRGVTPNEVDTLPHISSSQHRGETGNNTLTWVGFQPFETYTRVFLQTGRPAQYQVRESPDGLTITIRLRDTSVDFTNFYRWIDTSHFGRPVNMIDTARSDDGVTEVTIDLSRFAEYSIVAEGGYLFIDFPE